jgi:hypothetical protein
MRPKATAAAFLPSDSGVGASSAASPVAILAIRTALRFTSAGRFSPFGPRGIIQLSLALLAAKDSLFGRQKPLGELMTPQMIFSLWVLAFLAATLSVAIGCYTWIVLRGFQRSNHDSKALDILTSREGGLEFVTVAIVLPAAFMLRMNEEISPDAAMTLISGVLGYVLGQYGATQAKRRTFDSRPPQSN